MSDWIIRNATGDDLNFIYTKWCRTYRYKSAFGKLFNNNDIFFKEYNHLIDGILSKYPYTKVRIAALTEDPSVIIGFCVSDSNALHFIYVKAPFRNMGIGKDLYRDAGCPKTYTHKTLSISYYCKMHPELTFNPFILFKGDSHGSERTEATGSGNARQREGSITA